MKTFKELFLQEADGGNANEINEDNYLSHYELIAIANMGFNKELISHYNNKMGHTDEIEKMQDAIKSGYKAVEKLLSTKNTFFGYKPEKYDLLAPKTKPYSIW
jgi:hypothetical protein